jgi:ABC-type branched-subunit amino acid transport system ATPase component/branched-subunit amino acid ABC-type transport system permease component
MERSELMAASRVAAGALALFVFVGILYPAPPAILFLGVVLGSLSALVAMGLVLVYRANRIVNFAQGDMGAMASVLAASLIVGPKWPFFAAVAAGLLAAILVGFLVEVGIIRRFSGAPRLVLTVATIGVSQVLSFVQLGLPKLFDFDTTPQPPVPFDFTFEWFPVVFRGGHLLIIVAVPAVAVGLALFFRRSRVGIAVRASAESAARAALLGVPVKRINTLVWVLAAGMSGVGVLLRLPIQGVQIGQVLGPSLLLRALAAAVIGRMESLPRTMAAAVAIGVMESAVLFTTSRTVIVDGVLFAVIIVALLLQRQTDRGRAKDAGVETWGATREVRPIPRELMARREVRSVVTLLGVGLAAALVIVPLTWRPSQVSLFGVGVIMAIVICSLVLLTGWAGQISLGHLAILALGASVAGTMAQQGKDFFLCVAAAAAAGALVSVAIGFPALRIRGPFFAVTTLAFATAMGTFIINEEFFPWLVADSSVRVVRPVLFGKFDLESEHTFYLVVLLAFAFAAGVVWRVRNSRTGRALVGNRDNPRAVQAYGVDPKKAQLAAFGLSGLLAGGAGALYAFHQHGLAPGSSLLNPEYSIMLFAMGVIGGLGSVPGAVIGAAYLTFVNFSPYTREPLTQLLASGVGVLIVLMVFPAGLGGLLYDVRDRLLRAFASRRGILVPSLLADVRVEDVTDEKPVIGDATVATELRSVPSADPLLAVRGLELSYGKTQVLFGVDFHVERGEIVALLGTNGAGKSTLLNAICGLAKPSHGTVEYDGHDVTGWGPNATVAAGIVMMPGGKGVFPGLTVAENITLAGWRFKDDQEHLRQATDEALEMFPILRERWDQKAGNLSGGQQQMLTLAQAFISRPKLLMIDELSLGLAPVIVQQLLEIVKRIHANGTTIVVVEQSVNVAITLAQRAVFLEKGEVRFDGPTSDLLDRPEVLRAVFLEGAAAKRSAAAAGHRNGNGFVAVCDRCGHEHHDALELRDLSVSFGGVRAVDGVSFSVREQEIVGIIGPNGAGKTTVLDLVSGFAVPSSGRVLLGGTDVTDLDPYERAVLGLGRSFQDARLFPSMTVRQTIATALERHVPVRDPISALVLSPAVGVSEKWVDEQVTRLIDLMRLGAYADKFVGELSTGTRRIVDLACSLAHDPDVLLLDEPSSGIAQRETEALGPVLLDIRDQTGAALVVIEHDMPLITGISDQLVALELGAVVAIGEPADVVTDPRVVEGYLGSDQATINRSGAKVPVPLADHDGDGHDGAAASGRRRRAPLEATRR